MSLDARLNRPPDLPEPVATFLRRRADWIRRWIGWSVSGPEWVGFAWATDQLKAELESRGGSWKVGGLLFELEPSGGIAIEELC